MIKVEQEKDVTLIISTVSDFCDSMGYCEHKIPFHIKGILPPPSVETIQGAMSHRSEEMLEKEQFEFAPISQEDLADITKNIEFARENVHTRLLVPTSLGPNKTAVLIHGRADKIMRSNQTLMVQEDKFPSNLQKYQALFEPFESQKLQALAYLNSQFADSPSMDPDNWFDIPHSEKSWVIQIRDKNNGNKPFKIFRGTQNEAAQDYLASSIERFARLVLGKEERKHHNSPSRCKPCRLFDQCEFRLC